MIVRVFSNHWHDKFDQAPLSERIKETASQLDEERFVLGPLNRVGVGEKERRLKLRGKLNLNANSNHHISKQ